METTSQEQRIPGTAIPSLNSFPEYEAARIRYAEAQHELRSIEERINTVLTEMYYPPSTSVTTRERALAWLRREEKPEKRLSGLSEELSGLYDTRRILRAAVELQKHEVEAIGARLSKEMSQQVRPEHIKIVARIAAAVKALAEANEEEQQFRGALTTHGYTVHLRPLSFFRAGVASDPYSYANLFLKEVREYAPESLGLPPASSQPKKPPLMERIKKAVSREPEDEAEWPTNA